MRNRMAKPAVTGAQSAAEAGAAANKNRAGVIFFFFKQKTAYEIGLGIPAEPLFRSSVVSQRESVKNDKPTISMSLSHCIHQTLNSKASTRFHSGGLQQS